MIPFFSRVSAVEHSAILHFLYRCCRSHHLYLTLSPTFTPSWEALCIGFDMKEGTPLYSPYWCVRVVFACLCVETACFSVSIQLQVKMCGAPTIHTNTAIFGVTFPAPAGKMFSCRTACKWSTCQTQAGCTPTPRRRRYVHAVCSYHGVEMASWPMFPHDVYATMKRFFLQAAGMGRDFWRPPRKMLPVVVALFTYSVSTEYLGYTL